MSCQSCQNYKPKEVTFTVRELCRFLCGIDLSYKVTIEPTPSGGQRLIAVDSLFYQNRKIVLLDIPKRV